MTLVVVRPVIKVQEMKPYLSVHWPFHLGRVKFFPCLQIYITPQRFSRLFCLADAAHYYFPAIFIWREGARCNAREIATPVPQPTSPLSAFPTPCILIGWATTRRYVIRYSPLVAKSSSFEYENNRGWIGFRYLKLFCLDIFHKLVGCY